MSVRTTEDGGQGEAWPQGDQPFYDGPVRWLENPTADELEGFKALDWSGEVAGWIAAARNVGMQRSSLDSAAQDWLNWLGGVDRLAVIGVHLDGVQAVADLLGFVVEPATRLGIELVIGADHALADLDERAFIEPELGYPHALSRLRWRLSGAGSSRSRSRVPLELPETGFLPDPTQEAAVTAGEGVVQIIAPAGSGKTTVLIERVRELRRRGVPAGSIVCLTFNRAARIELEDRLGRAGVGDVKAYTFHGFGFAILAKAKRLRAVRKPRTVSQGTWRWLMVEARRAVGENGVWLDPADAQRELSNIKLGLMMTPEEYAATITGDSTPVEHTMAALYPAYEALLRRDECLDNDDLILLALRLLRADAQARATWQDRYHHVLVDEYQDIEPAQELLVRLVGAPHDQLFCVGDEDQTLYAFRRASVERIICLDGLFPGLQRIPLGINYRCPENIVAASKALIDHNHVRFPKSIAHNPKSNVPGVIDLRKTGKLVEDATEIAKLLGTRQRGEIVVLARTTNALRPVALACADIGVAIDGHDKLFEPTGARRALQEHLELVLHPTEADADLVYSVCQTPGRSLRRGSEQAVAQQLQAGQPFETVFAGVEAPRRGRRDRPPLWAPGELFAQLAIIDNAVEAVALLRTAGGLDQWFEENDSLDGLDQFECEVLEQAEVEADGLTPQQYLDLLKQQARRLRAIRDREHGRELATIHGAKGREWPHVVLIACDEGTLPHARSLEVGFEETARGEGVEAERRLGYVAFTRAQERLQIHYDAERPSRFLNESGILGPKRAPRTPPPPPQPPGPASPKRGLLARLLGD